jgi:hypothetical protein
MPGRMPSRAAPTGVFYNLTSLLAAEVSSAQLAFLEALPKLTPTRVNITLTCEVANTGGRVGERVAGGTGARQVGGPPPSFTL